MTKMYEALAEAFHAEGVDTLFGLMGDGNMHWSTTLAKLPGVVAVHVRHEHTAVAAASAYHLATGKIGAASVTCGPGLTQIMTALPAAVRAHIPMVIFSGESPIDARFYNQYIDQAPFVRACGANYLAAHSLPRMLDHVQEAFHIARVDRVPVVLGVPYDLQKAAFEGRSTYVPSTMCLPEVGRTLPDPELLALAVRKLATAKRPVIIGGRGALRSGATAQLSALADRCGAMLGETLPVRGMFHSHAFGLGVVGGYGSRVQRDVMEAADVVIAFGTSLSYYTQDGGHLFPGAYVIQVDEAPRGLKDGLAAVDLFLKGDARATAEQLIAGVDASVGKGRPTAAAIRSNKIAERIATELPDDAEFDIAPGVVDPRVAIRALDAAIPKDWDIVSGSGHQAYFNASMRGRPAECFTTIREFGAVGNGLSYALGVAAARRNNGKVVLIEGDGGFLMHVQELETITRCGLKVLICIFNDGAYGSEIHKLRADGIDDSHAIFGRPGFEDIARGFGLNGAEVRDVGQIGKLFSAFEQQGNAEIWNIQISDQVTAPTMRKTLARGHGVM